MPELPGIVAVAFTLLVCLGAVGIGWAICKRAFGEEDPSVAFGISGLIGLGTLGFFSLVLGCVRGGFGSLGLAVFLGASFVGLVFFFKDRRSFAFQLPKANESLFLVPTFLFILFVLVSTLAPSDINDWDSLAYHLAVPKLWLQAGKIEFIPSIHHSNFPFTVDILNVWGLMWGGQTGAKAFQFGFFLIGAIAIFGLSRNRYGQTAAWWSVLAFVSVPVVLWEAGSAYIDVAHGLYAGCGLLVAARAASDRTARSHWLVAGLLLGFAVGSKYTGLQMVVTVGVVLVIAGALGKDLPSNFGSAVAIASVALAVGSPWYIKTLANTGNPVYPFFFEKLGGKNWDQRRADIYRNEQQTFGVSRTATGRDITGIGAAVLGVAYQPGRFVNPGQTQGMGNPLGAVGVALVAILILLPVAGLRGRFEGIVWGGIGFSLLLWFLLSQQSRYIVPLAVPLSVLAGGLVIERKFGKMAMSLITLQALYSLWLVETQRTSSQLQVALGKVPQSEYQTKGIPFYSASQGINSSVKNGKVALYDEVFGFLLDVPYFWANPGHCTLIPYDSLNDGQSYCRALRDQGITHVYISLSPVVKDRAFAKRWLGSMGLGDASNSFPAEERSALLSNWETKWHVLLSDAVREGRLVPEQSFRSGILFRIVS